MRSRSALARRRSGWGHPLKETGGPTGPPVLNVSCRNGALVGRRRLQLGDVRFAADGHHAHLIGPVDWHADLDRAATLVDREVAHFGAAYRQFEHGPLLRCGVVLEDLVVRPEIAPYVMLAVDVDVIRLHRRIRE